MTWIRCRTGICVTWTYPPRPARDATRLIRLAQVPPECHLTVPPRARSLRENPFDGLSGLLGTVGQVGPCEVDDPPTQERELVSPSLVAFPLCTPGVIPVTVCLDRQPRLRVGEVDPRDKLPLAAN